LIFDNIIFEKNTACFNRISGAENMKTIAINGSPRKKWNTATLLEKALEGAASQGSQTELVHLYDLDYKGCTSCFACKLPGGKSHGICAMRDELAPILEKVITSDALILGSPVYYGSVTGEMRSFLERLMFQYLVYDKSYSSLFKGNLSAAFFYTMNVTEQGMADRKYEESFKLTEGAIQRTLKLNKLHTLHVTDTYQFDDYKKFQITAFDPELKKKRKMEEFPKDCERAYEIGKILAKK
jgi:multimeric flavodoxin WrbA